MPKISMFVKLTAKPGKRPELVAAFESVRPLVDAEEGTELYTVHLDQADENVVWVLELYTDQAALDAHGSGPAITQLFSQVGDLIGAPPEMHLANPVASKGIDV